jgi:phenylacetate-CoA ligase
MRWLETTQWMDRNRIVELQLARLNVLLRSARSDSPAYASRLAALPRHITSLDDLRRAPTLNKQQLRNEHTALASSKRGWLCVRKTTGGSTGEPVTVLKTRPAMAWELAATWRGYGWAGVAVGDRQARFWGVPLTATARLRAQLIDFVSHRVRFSAFAFNRRSFIDYERRLLESSPDWFYGYTSMLAELARWYHDERRVCPIQPRAVVTTSEVLSPDDRAVIERSYRSRVFNEYGCGELGTIAHECELGRLHTSDENMIIEILDGDRPCAPGEKGEIVVTELNNIAMPLVRYRTGDFASYASNECPCGRSLGVLEQVYGRAYDFIVSPSGRRFHAEFLMYVFEEAQRHQIGIAQFQVRQTSTNSLHVIVVPAPGGFESNARQSLVKRIQSLLGENMNIAVTCTERIPREPSGKMRVIVGLPNSGQ